MGGAELERPVEHGEALLVAGRWPVVYGHPHQTEPNGWDGWSVLAEASEGETGRGHGDSK